MAANTTEYFDGDVVSGLRKAAREVGHPEEHESDFEGWIKRPDDPMRLLSVFEALHIEPGFTLIGYQHLSGGNGKGVVWAIPEGAAYPEPEDCPTLEGRFLKPPRPPEALDDFMEVIQGDGWPLSYLSASIFSRELHEFGAMWHGVSWGWSRVIDREPESLNGEWNLVEKHDDLFPFDQDRDRWRCHEPKPDDWRPRVEISGESATVTLLCFSRLVEEKIFRLTDRYNVGSYVYDWEQCDLASGPAGCIP